MALFGAIAASVAAMAGLATLVATVWSRLHSRLPGGRWLLSWTGTGYIYELRNNTGTTAVDVELSGPTIAGDRGGRFDRIDAGAPVFPVIQPYGPRLPLTVTWSTRSGRRHTYCHEVPFATPDDPFGPVVRLA
jgi:hypothetical protein